MATARARRWLETATPMPPWINSGSVASAPWVRVALLTVLLGVLPRCLPVARQHGRACVRTNRGERHAPRDRMSHLDRYASPDDHHIGRERRKGTGRLWVRVGFPRQGEVLAGLHTNPCRKQDPLIGNHVSCDPRHHGGRRR